MLRIVKSSLVQRRWAMLIVDESHNLRYSRASSKQDAAQVACALHRTAWLVAMRRGWRRASTCCGTCRTSRSCPALRPCAGPSTSTRKSMLYARPSLVRLARRAGLALRAAW
eukprot:scaffold2608_cov362-Prasinococcus_capsulatus_cf.AAC.10